MRVREENTAWRKTIHRMWEWGDETMFDPNPAPKTKVKIGMKKNENREGQSECTNIQRLIVFEIPKNKIIESPKITVHL